MASKEWVRFNEDAKAMQFRAIHVEKHGGEFIYRGKSRGWHWVNGNSTPAPKVESFSKKKKTSKK
jgi:hypothetical protein